jgi:hypothetical protein
MPLSWPVLTSAGRGAFLPARERRRREKWRRPVTTRATDWKVRAPGPQVRKETAASVFRQCQRFERLLEVLRQRRIKLAPGTVPRMPER